MDAAGDSWRWRQRAYSSVMSIQVIEPSADERKTRDEREHGHQRASFGFARDLDPEPEWLGNPS